MKHFFLTFCLCFVSTLNALQLQQEDIISMKKEDVQHVMVNIKPYVKELSDKDKELVKSKLLSCITDFVKYSYSENESVNNVELQVVLINNMDEYARPDFSSMSRIAKISYHRGADKLFNESILELNIDLL